jgi:hypothetical protein
MGRPEEIVLRLTESQVVSLLDYIEINFIQAIRDDTDVDSIEYVCNICDVYKKLKKIRGKLNG